MAPIAQTQSQSPPIAEKSLKQLYEWHRDEFYNWLKVKGVSAKTIKGYISALDRHIPDVDSPKALKQYLATTEGLPMDKLTKGLKNLFNYLKEIDEEHEATWAKWHGAVKVPQSGVREVYISNDELLEAYEHIKYEGNEVALTVFKALVFSGMRLSHLLELLQEWDGAKVVKVQEGKVCRYPATHVSKGQKKAFWLYFPCAFRHELESITHKEISYHVVQKAISYKRVSANSIRKWLLNFLIAHGVSESVADFIEGRAAITVGSAHYLNKTQQADKAYKSIVDKFPIKP